MNPATSAQDIKIALVRQRYRPDGGAERFVARAIEALGGKGVSLTLITREWAASGAMDVIECKPFSLGRVWREWGFMQAACHVVTDSDFDLVQSHERIPCCDIYRAGDGVHAEWLAQRARTRGPLGRAWLRISPFHVYMRAAERRLFASPRLKAVICISNMVRQEIRERFALTDDKLHLIYNGIDTNAFSPDVKAHRSVIRQRHGIADNAGVFLFVGSGFARKGLDVLLSALAQLPKRAVLLVVGKDKHLSRYKRTCKRLSIAERVHFVGGQEDVKPYYGAADVLVHPTLYEPFGNVVLEALACALPVIVSNKCGAGDLVKHGVNGFVCDALDSAELAEYMDTLLNKKRAANFAKVARKSAEPYTLEHVAESLIKLYHSLLS